MSPLTLEVVRDAVKGAAAAFRSRRHLQPAGGGSDKVFPPTFAGAVYAIEQRRIPGLCSRPWVAQPLVSAAPPPGAARRGAHA